MKKRKIYYSPSPSNPCKPDEIYIPIKKYSNTFSNNSTFFRCPAWQHQSSKIFTVYASCNLHLQIDEQNRIFSNNLNQNEMERYIVLNQNWNEENFPTIQIVDLFTNFYWTNQKNIWISVLPHPLTSLNNNFYHCGAWFNLSNWARNVNIGAIIVDKNKPLIIKRGDPLYNIKFHTHNQNDDFELVHNEFNEKDVVKSYERVNFINSGLAKDFDYQSIIFDSSHKSKCPFSFLWKK